jgi:hypothetical protein
VQQQGLFFNNRHQSREQPSVPCIALGQDILVTIGLTLSIREELQAASRGERLDYAACRNMNTKVEQHTSSYLDILVTTTNVS